MTQRDDFLKPTRRALAARAGWKCSFTGCGKLTIGPSEESPESSACIGEAAHISAASPGGRRYDGNLTHEERVNISNGIWLCADHAKLIDRDEETYTSDMLRKMKRDHEAMCTLAIRSGAGGDLDSHLFSIGSNFVFTGSFEQVEFATWTLQVKHFLIGDLQGLISYISDFGLQEEGERYVVSNQLGDGRILIGAPRLVRRQTQISVICPIAANAPRVDVQRIGSSIAIDPDTNDLFLDKAGNIARISGLDYFPQRVREVLSMQRGESLLAPRWGALLFEYFSAYQDSPWLSLLFMLEVVRHASIPATDSIQGRCYTPLRCVTRVYRVELLAAEPVNSGLPIRVEFEVQGLGRWQHDIIVYMPTKVQMIESKNKLAMHSFQPSHRGDH